MKHLSHMKQVSANCTWYALAKGATRKKAAKWLRRKPVEAYIQGRYARYCRTILAFNRAPRPSNARKSDKLMRDFYLRPPADVKAVLKERRNEHLLTECPSCGNPFTPDTLDHFLPKEDWPEYAILPNNLVPQCRGCAPSKGERYYCGTAASALFLHPMYSEALASVRFRIDVTLKDGKPEFAVEISVGTTLGSSDFERVLRHLKELGVKKRMTVFCFRYYSHWKCKLLEDGFDIEALFRLQLGQQLGRDHGRNWAIAFMQGVLRNPAAVADLQRWASRTPVLPPETLVALPL